MDQESIDLEYILSPFFIKKDLSTSTIPSPPLPLASLQKDMGIVTPELSGLGEPKEGSRKRRSPGRSQNDRGEGESPCHKRPHREVSRVPSPMSLTDPKIDASGVNERTQTASVGPQQGILEPKYDRIRELVHASNFGSDGSIEVTRKADVMSAMFRNFTSGGRGEGQQQQLQEVQQVQQVQEQQQHQAQQISIVTRPASPAEREETSTCTSSSTSTAQFQAPGCSNSGPPPSIMALACSAAKTNTPPPPAVEVEVEKAPSPTAHMMQCASLQHMINLQIQRRLRLEAFQRARRLARISELIRFKILNQRRISALRASYRPGLETVVEVEVEEEELTRRN
ncbi:hypothetical protein TrST_g1477 [Triparma strigata]|uniref:Uncharacterized protein n=1 Tax=Triparma strigata TaxID=1606541 RepID=A0A9W7AP62_9STRA|nr:hypothetical protein TrST_g1477 [Triparma strigata]